MKKVFALFALAALLLTGCGLDQGYDNVSADSNYVGVCTNLNGIRVDDSYCQNVPAYYQNGGMGNFFWGYLVASSMMPRYGAPVTHYVTYVDTRSHNVYRGGVPRTGGSLNYQTYKPKSQTVTKSDVSLKSDKYNYSYNKSPNYTKPKSDYKAPSGSNYKKSGGGSVYKAPAGGGYRRR